MTDTTKAQKALNPDRLPFGKFLAWKMRDISVAAITIVCGYLTIFCTDTLGVSPAMLGTLIMASKIFDGVTDLFATYIIENTHTRFGKARPYELCIFGVWGCTILLFSASPEWSMFAKYAWIFVMYTFIFSIFNTLVGTANTPYLMRAFANRTVITKVSSYGGIVTMLGSMVVSVTFPMLMGKLATSAGGWRTLVAIYGVPLACIGFLRFIFVKEVVDIDDGTTPKISLKMIFAMLKSNGWAWIMALMMGVFNITISLNVAAYYFKYIVGSYTVMGLLQMSSMVMLIGMLFMPRIIKRFSVAAIIGCSSLISAAGFVLVFIGKTNIPVLAVGGVLGGIASLPLAYLQILIIMDVCTYNEWKGMPRMETTVSVVSNFTAKVCAAIGAALSGFLLELAGYNGALEVQGDDAIMMIRLLYSLIPALGFVLIFLVTLKLRGLSKIIPQLSKEIAERKAAAAAQT
jgi:probable glucitol transport protein GutA